MLQNVIDCIKQGLADAYAQNQQMKERMIEPPNSITEYLFTVGVAKALLACERLQSGKELLVQVECGATDFVNNAFARLKFNPFQTRRKHRTNRKGRIDIAISELGQNLSIRSLVGIELKGINPPPKKVHADLKRLAHAMREQDPISKNSIERSFSAYVVRLNRKNELFDASAMQPRMADFREQLIRDLNRVFRRTRNIHFTVDVWPIDVKGADEAAVELHPDDRDRKEVASRTRAAAGVLVALEYY